MQIQHMYIQRLAYIQILLICNFVIYYDALFGFLFLIHCYGY